MGDFEERFNDYIESITAAMLGRIQHYGARGGDEHDVFQEACLKYYRWLSGLGPDQDPSAHEGMLHRMAFQCAMDELRRRKARRDLVRPDTEPDDEADPERIFGPDGRPGPEAILLRREREDRCREFLAAATRCPGKRVLAGVLKIAQGCSPSETVEFIESYLFHNGAKSSAPRSEITDQLCAQLGITENGVAASCHRLRSAWVQLKREILGEQLHARRWRNKLNADGHDEKRRKTERSRACRAFSK